MKALRVIVSALLIAAVAGLLFYQGMVTKNLETGNLVRGLLIIAGAVAAMFKTPKRRSVPNKKALYQKAYPEFIQDPFSDQPKLEKLFYHAVHDYNQRKPSAAVAKLEKLRRECQRTSDLRAVTIFTALCLNDMQKYEAAIGQYDAALKIRDSSTLHSNMGLCYQKLGDFQAAEDSYLRATRSDPKNAYAWNNLSALYFRKGDYAQALSYAEHAITLSSRMPEALSTAAICSHLLGNFPEYERYYRQAVTYGYDGNKIKKVIRMMNPET